MYVDAGQLSITLTLHDGVLRDVAVHSSRPQVAERVLGGRSVDEALALVPNLFSVCGRAQALAATLAVEAARGAEDDGAQPAARVQALEAEIAQEVLWRLLLDWPRLLGEEPDTALLAQVRSALTADAGADRAALRAAVEQAVFAGPARTWWEHEHVPAFEIWIAQAQTVAARVLGAVQRDGGQHGAPRSAAAVPLVPAPPTASELHSIAAQVQADPRYAQVPELDGRPAETGAVARLRGHPLVSALQRSFGRSSLTRLAARLTELARIACGAPAGAPLCGRLAVAPGRGLGWVETARGLLVHLVQLDGARVAAWRIVAPTEWNFHPRGALPAGLVGAHVARAQDALTRAQWLVQALDPCVQFSLQLRDGQMRPGEAAHA
jgi:coenzyme F420-reducing hydrogenase alpha subunit